MEKKYTIVPGILSDGWDCKKKLWNRTVTIGYIIATSWHKKDTDRYWTPTQLDVIAKRYSDHEWCRMHFTSLAEAKEWVLANADELYLDGPDMWNFLEDNS